MTGMNNTSDTARETSSGSTPTAATVLEALAQPDRKTRFMARALIPFLVLLMAAAILYGIAGSWNARVGDQTYQKTDDATLRADITPLSTRVSGDVVRVAVEDYQHVKAGDLLIQVKDSDYRAQVGQAEAAVRAGQAALETNQRQNELQDSRTEQARTGVEAARAEIEQAGAGVQAAQADRNNALSGVDGATAAESAAQANVEGARAQVQVAQANVEGAKADVQAAQANVEGAAASVETAQTNIAGTQADVERTRQERARQESLVSLGSATRQKLEQVVAEDERYKAMLAGRQADMLEGKAVLASRQAALLQANTLITSRQAALRQFQTLFVSQRAALLQARAQRAGRRSDLAKSGAHLTLRQAALTQARAQLAGRTADLETQILQRPLLAAQRAELRADLNAKQEALKVAQTNLEYTRILAPADGMVGERQVRVGQLVSPGTQVIALIENTVWIQANYEETQLPHVRKGDSAEATVDGLPGVVLKGHVAEISPASGSQFALLPPDNATGNYTKIAQRIPVKIVLDPDPEVMGQLRPGMSVVVKIKTSGKAERR